MSDPQLLKLLIIVCAATFAILLRFIPKLRGYQFTAWIIAVVTAAMFYPAQFLHVGDFDLKNKWVMLIAIQMVMFSMGTQMSLHDFAGVAKSPRGVFVGIFCHFTVMPLVGLALTKIFRFEPEIAAGVILIGSCSSGLSSNVMAYIAKSNLALSVTVTAVTTMIAPLMTPLWMKLLAGTMVKVSCFAMMVDIIKIVLVPIGAALLHDYLKHASPRGRKIVLALAALAVAWLGFLFFGGWAMLKNNFTGDALTAIGLFGFLLSAFIMGATYHALVSRAGWLDRFMPTFAIIGILYVTAMTTASGRDNLLKVGLLLFFAAMLHNLAGYFFGYFLSRGAGLDKNSARSIAFEVGLQNGGMASGLASAMGKLATVGLAAAIFIPWMNISGSMLANYWSKRPASDRTEIV
ncbi:MAG: bile acid:sodium symporter family protein [Verrucomicrobiae bacterium]|nr:bile acid:sodium symporter family protein [Verrucomicrobiae bacterium]